MGTAFDMRQPDRRKPVGDILSLYLLATHPNGVDKMLVCHNRKLLISGLIGLNNWCDKIEGGTKTRLQKKSEKQQLDDEITDFNKAKKFICTADQPFSFTGTARQIWTAISGALNLEYRFLSSPKLFRKFLLYWSAIYEAEPADQMHVTRKEYSKITTFTLTVTTL